MKLTPKQQAFCDYYIETANASESARRAGYSEKTAPYIGAENLKKPQVREYITSRMAELAAKRQATADEVMEFYTSTMRGEVKDQFGLDAALSDRLKAADSLMKRFAVTEQQQADEPEREDELSKSLRELAEEMNGKNEDEGTVD